VYGLLRNISPNSHGLARFPGCVERRASISNIGILCSPVRCEPSRARRRKYLLAEALENTWNTIEPSLRAVYLFEQCFDPLDDTVLLGEWRDRNDEIADPGLCQGLSCNAVLFRIYTSLYGRSADSLRVLNTCLNQDFCADLADRAEKKIR